MRSTFQNTVRNRSFGSQFISRFRGMKIAEEEFLLFSDSNEVWRSIGRSPLHAVRKFVVRTRESLEKNVVPEKRVGKLCIDFDQLCHR